MIDEFWRLLAVTPEMIRLNRQINDLSPRPGLPVRLTLDFAAAPPAQGKA